MSETSNAAEVPVAEGKNEPSIQPTHDGIEEHDNFLPRWWLATLFGAVLFSFAYWFYYHTAYVGLSQGQELEADEKALSDLRLKAFASKVTDEQLLALTKDAALVARGKQTFQTICTACHASKGEGNIGPNLTDAYWIHGGKPVDIYKTVTMGVPEKGMLAWGPTLGPVKVQEVVAFVLTIKNTNVPGKAPQGNKEP